MGLESLDHPCGNNHIGAFLILEPEEFLFDLYRTLTHPADLVVQTSERGIQLTLEFLDGEVDSLGLAISAGAVQDIPHMNPSKKVHSNWRPSSGRSRSPLPVDHGPARTTCH